MNWPLAASATWKESSLAREDTRLTEHFNAVLEELERRDVSAFDSRWRAARQLQIARLKRYRDAGRFPRNEGQRPHETPIFRDRAGTWCAMGQLIAESGAESFAREVGDQRNLATIDALTDDVRLHAWLRANGLDVHEAARIQPSYGPTEPWPCICRGHGAATSEAVVPLRVSVGPGGDVAVVEEAHGEGFEQGDQLGVGDQRPAQGTYVVLADTNPQIGFEVPYLYLWLPVSAKEGEVSCPDSYLGTWGDGICRDPSLSYDQTIAALTAESCFMYLEENAPAWTQRCPGPRGIGSGCSIHGGPSDVVGAAASLIAVSLAARLRRRPRRG